MATPTRNSGARPVRIAITGGIGAGKSAALAAFARAGAATFSADDAVHALYGDPAVRELVRARWGDAILDTDGDVDRSAVARIVFADPAELAWLEAELHPRVAQVFREFARETAAHTPAPAIIAAEVPLLYEAGQHDAYDYVVAITAPLDVRLARVGERARGDVAASQRSARQLPEAEKAARADFHYVNDGSFDGLDGFVARVIDEVTR